MSFAGHDSRATMSRYSHVRLDGSKEPRLNRLCRDPALVNMPPRYRGYRSVDAIESRADSLPAGLALSSEERAGFDSLKGRSREATGRPTR
jgi:hypothetical protein